MIRKWTYEINLNVNVESTSHKISKNHNKITKIMKSLPEQGEGGFGGVAGIRSQRGGGARQWGPRGQQWQWRRWWIQGLTNPAPFTKILLNSIHNLDRPLLYSSSRRSASPVQRLQSAEEKANLQPELNQKLPPLHLRGPARCPAQTHRWRWASRGRLPEGREWRKTRSGMLSFWESQVETRISVFLARIRRKVFLFESDL